MKNKLVVDVTYSAVERKMLKITTDERNEFIKDIERMSEDQKMLNKVKQKLKMGKYSSDYQLKLFQYNTSMYESEANLRQRSELIEQRDINELLDSLGLLQNDSDDVDMETVEIADATVNFVDALEEEQRDYEPFDEAFDADEGDGNTFDEY